jgi:hypothetical protein
VDLTVKSRFILLAGIIAGAYAPVAVACDDNLFAAASAAPADATMYVHIRDGKLLRSELTRRPIGRWVESALAAGQVRDAWQTLAAHAGVTSDALFDACLGNHVTIVIRDDENGESPSEWALLTEVEVDHVRRIEGKLEPTLAGPRSGMRLMELPEHGLLLARHKQRLVVGSSQCRELFLQVVDGAAGRGKSTLATHPAIVRGQELGTGQAGILIRHAPPLGGWSVAVASLDGERIDVRHSARFDTAPWTRPVTKIECDFSPVVALEPRALIVMMEPTDVDGGLAEVFIEDYLGFQLLGREIEQTVGSRRVLTVGEEEGRTLERPMDLLTTTAGVAIEIEADEAALARIDEQMVRFSNRIATLGEGSFLIDVPNSLPATGPRQIDISPATSWFTGGFPIMRNITLNWNVAEGLDASWLVIASHEHHLSELTDALAQTGPARPIVGRFDSVGTADGQRIGRHLRSWADGANLFVHEDTPPKMTEDFKATMTLLSEFCSGISRCHWKLARPTPTEMRVDVQLFLSPAESADGEP